MDWWESEKLNWRESEAAGKSTLKCSKLPESSCFCLINSGTIRER
jgi:hypothetical protein